MALPRRPIASWATLLRQRSATTLRTAHAPRSGRLGRVRGYASSSGGGAAKKSDIPWLLGSVGITVPALWYIGLWKPDPNAHHGHDDHHEKHEDHEDGEGDDAASEEGESASGEDSDGGSQGSKEAGKADDAKTDKASPAKPAESQNQTSGKQEGVANADTKHSTDPENDPGKSDKPEGGPDTAKVKGTVDSTRPQK